MGTRMYNASTGRFEGRGSDSGNAFLKSTGGDNHSWSEVVSEEVVSPGIERFGPVRARKLGPRSDDLLCRGADSPQQTGKQLIAGVHTELAEDRAEVRADRVGAAIELLPDLLGVGKAAAHPEHDVELGLRKGRKVVGRSTRESNRTVRSLAVADGFVIGFWKGPSV